MLPQLTDYAKILYLLMVVISGALCVTEHVFLQCQKPERSVFINKIGRVTTRSKRCQPQFFTIEDDHNLTIPDKFRITLRVENTEMYLCLGNETMEWKPVGRVGKRDALPELCYFTETVKNGYFQFRSVVNETKIVHLKSSNGNCTSFQKLNNVAVTTFSRICKPHRKRGQDSNSNTSGSSSTQQHQELIHIRHNHTHNRRINHGNKSITTTTTTTTTTKPPHSSDTGILSKNYGKRGRKRRLHKTHKNAKHNHQPVKHRNSRKAQIHTRSESILNRSSLNIQDEYSNDDASAIVVLPNSSTESQFTRNSNSPKYSSNKPIRKRKSSRLSRVNANHNTIPDS